MEHHNLQNVYDKIREERDVKGKIGVDGIQEKKIKHNYGSSTGYQMLLLF